jgi:3'-phosphoadenosine 5'-phosphosulfate sulfotransferase (PAPS reductase)/FAD synthetase
MQVIEMFSASEMSSLVMTIEEKIEKAKQSISRLFDAGQPAVVAYSAGKDSSTVALLVLIVAKEHTSRGGQPLVIISNGDTLVENPEVSVHVKQELRKMRTYAKHHGFRLLTSIAKPALLSTFQIKTLTGRGIPSFASGSNDCSIDLKVQSQLSARKKLFRKLASEGLPEPVSLLGIRSSESESRDQKMKARRDNPDEPVRNKQGDLVLCPIANWSTDDVWEAIGMAANNLIDTYSDFAETKRIYGAAMGTSCAVVADALYEGTSRPKGGGCGARLGCWSCLKAEDKSLQNMLDFDPRYEYARGLNKLNQFLRATQYDWKRRHWVGRTIRKGYIAIQPDTYHPSMVRELFRYMLQLDKDERDLARREGRDVMFEILPTEMIFAIDALQSLQGLARPYQCWADYRDVNQRGIRYDIPEVETVPMTPLPDARFLFVGEDWDSGTGDYTWSGLRNPYHETLTADSPCEPALRPNKNGNMIWSVPTEQSFSVDPEVCAFFEDYELERLLEQFDRGIFINGVTEGYKNYVYRNVLVLSHAQNLEHDMFCRRTEHKQRLGLTIDYDIDALVAKTVSFAAMPNDARKAWAHKASTATAQTDLWDEVHPMDELELEIA